MNCLNPITLQIKKNPWAYPDGLTVSCGKCLNCRIQKSKEWSIRLLHELSYHRDALFITLTYNEKNLPFKMATECQDIETNSDEIEDTIYSTVVKKDLQDYIKRVRKALNGRTIKYYGCGEYGDEAQRAHYHILMFNVSHMDIDTLIKCWKKCDWTPKRIKKSFGLVEPKSINYVTGYIRKKYSGEKAKEEYVKKNRDEVFKIQSQGLGLQFALDNKKQIAEQGYVTMFGVKQSIPRYYINKLELDVTELQEKAKDTECLLTKKHAGVKVSEIELYKNSTPQEYRRYDESIKKSRTQHDTNLKKRIALHKKTL